MVLQMTEKPIELTTSEILEKAKQIQQEDIQSLNRIIGLVEKSKKTATNLGKNNRLKEM